MNKAIAELNDRFRQGDRSLGKYKMTAVVGCLTSEKLTQLLQLVQQFNQFNSDNDPWQEHDFGKVMLDGEDYFFKIDYYDPTLTRHSNDPASPNATTRVLTLMRSDEY